MDAHSLIVSQDGTTVVIEPVAADVVAVLKSGLQAEGLRVLVAFFKPADERPAYTLRLLDADAVHVQQRLQRLLQHAW